MKNRKLKKEIDEVRAQCSIVRRNRFLTEVNNAFANENDELQLENSAT